MSLDSGPQSPSPGEVAATPAGTVVPLRDGTDGLEVLLLRRRAGGAFGGMWVFPGGRVEPADRAAARREGLSQWPGVDVEEVAAARRAATREAREEAALLLEESSLRPLSFWLPPTVAPRRFATWFFVAAVPEADVAVDGAEIEAHRWIAPAAAMSEQALGEMALAPPTYMTLWGLGRHESAASAVEAAPQGPPPRFLTRAIIGPNGGITATLWEGDTAYDGDDLAAPGPRRRLTLDPAGWRVEMAD